MTLTITLKPELEAWLEQESLAQDTSAEEVAVRELESRWATSKNQPELLSAAESQLLLKINEGFPDEFWQRFRILRQQLEKETIAERDRQEFLKSYEVVEAKNAERMAYLLQLARLRRLTLPEIMQQLGIGPIQTA